MNRLVPTFALSWTLLIISATVAAQPSFQLTLHSEPGDWVGQGLDYVFTEADGDLTTQVLDTTNDGLLDSVTFHFLDGSSGTFWT
jgi:hypothetical protein